MTDPCITPKKGHCDGCGAKLFGRRTRWCSRRCSSAHTANHRWTQARAAAKKRVMVYRCESCGTATDTVEVNHIVPCKGKHGVWGCWHHTDNLEVLCKPCHLQATALQRKNGLL